MLVLRSCRFEKCIWRRLFNAELYLRANFWSLSNILVDSPASIDEFVQSKNTERLTLWIGIKFEPQVMIHNCEEFNHFDPPGSSNASIETFWKFRYHSHPSGKCEWKHAAFELLANWREWSVSSEWHAALPVRYLSPKKKRISSSHFKISSWWQVDANCKSMNTNLSEKRYVQRAEKLTKRRRN